MNQTAELTQSSDEMHLDPNDPRAFEQIVRTFQPKVARLAQRLTSWSGDVDDIVQDVFLGVYSNAKQYRGDGLWAWITRITMNKCRSRWRRQQLGERRNHFSSEPCSRRQM